MTLADEANEEDFVSCDWDGCCLHDKRAGEEHYPGQVCCRCGDIYASRWTEDMHGEYAPTTEARAP